MRRGDVEEDERRMIMKRKQRTMKRRKWGRMWRRKHKYKLPSSNQSILPYLYS